MKMNASAKHVGKILLLLPFLLLLVSCQNPAAQDPKDVLTVKADDWIKGSKQARVVLVEYSDFQCPACGAYYPLVKKLNQDFGDKLLIVYRHFPLTSLHRNAQAAARASEAAGKQGKFWQMHDMLFEQQQSWSEENNVEGIFAGYAVSLGLNKETFLKDLNDASVTGKVDRDRQGGEALRVNSTPTFYLNGKKMDSPGSYELFKKLVEATITVSESTSGNSSTTNANATSETYHVHADLKVYVNGKALDLSGDKYKSDSKTHLDEYVHLHSNNGEVVHVHKKGITLGDFLKSLKMELSGTCLVNDAGQKFCNDASNTLKLYVNGKTNASLEKYIPQDLDRMLISYGPEKTESELKTQLDSVTDKACIYSEKCPERGPAPKEDCVGGLNVPCAE